MCVRVRACACSVVHGANDRCTSAPAARRLVERAGSADKLFRELPGGYHELLHGPEWRDCSLAMADWILARVPAQAQAQGGAAGAQAGSTAPRSHAAQGGLQADSRL